MNSNLHILSGVATFQLEKYRKRHFLDRISFSRFSWDQESHFRFMNEDKNNRICLHKFKAQEIISRYPAQLHDRNKEIVFHLASPPDAAHGGEITFSRWRQFPFPDRFARPRGLPDFELMEEFFAYDPFPEGALEWHLNFAHYDLFCAYGSSLFAQDEMQVAEHPALASLREALLDLGIAPLTVENRFPTPALIMGVERRCRVETSPDALEERPHGLYGNHFAAASENAIRRATTILEPPTKSNILAMEAPAGGIGQYSIREIDFILATAFTGFSAVSRQSRETPSKANRVVVHTGYWGCGAYGGNRVLMTLLQMIAASFSGLDSLVFHSGGDNEPYRDALSLLDQLLPVDRPVAVNRLIAQIEELRFAWGVSDGN